MLEMLYATGLRVSELVALKLSQVSLDMGVVRVMGKGSKERLVPLGEEALGLDHALPAAKARPRLLGGARSDALFVTARGAAMTRQAFWYLIKRHARTRGLEQADVAAHAAPRLRHPSAQPRRRSARGADAARPRRHLDHADLHARGARAPEAAAREASPAG